jgi:hypothetical protein
VVLFFGQDVQANGFIGNGGAGTTMDDLNGNQLDNAKAGFVGGGIIWARQPGAGPIRGITVPPGTPAWGSEWKGAIKAAFRHSFYYEVQGACMSYRNHYLDLDPTYKDGFGRPLLRMTFDWHQNEIKASQFLVGKALDMCKTLKPQALSGDAKKDGSHYNITQYQSTHTCGGAIMGADPRTSALNRYLQSWDVPNVFAPGANAFPQNNGYNPTGLVGALTYWSAKAIREQYLKSPAHWCRPSESHEAVVHRRLFACVVAVGVLLIVVVLLALWPTRTRVLADTIRPDEGELEHGRYVAIASDCSACHTAPKGSAYAGGLKIASPLGAIYSTNITPDRETGIGSYSLNDFDRAVRHGIGLPETSRCIRRCPIPHMRT